MSSRLGCNRRPTTPFAPISRRRSASSTPTTNNQQLTTNNQLFPHPIADRQPQFAPVAAPVIAGAPGSIDGGLNHHMRLPRRRGNIEKDGIAPQVAFEHEV